MKKIAIDIRELEKNKLTGIGRFLTDFLSYAVSFQNEFDFVLVGNQNTDYENPLLNKYRVFNLYESNTFIWDQLVLPRLLKKEKIDLFFSPYYKIPLFTDVPVISCIFDLIFLKVKPYKYYLKNRIYIKNFIKLTLKKSKFIVTNSNATRKDILNFYGNKYSDKIKFFYHKINGSVFYRRDEYEVKKIREKYNLTDNYILYVGNSKPHKNLNRLINAYKLLDKTYREKYMLVLVGVKENYEDSGIITLNYLDNDELAAIYSGAELFVFPSLYEGFGYPPLEAMACGCPVISSNISSMPEILGDAALYFDPYDVNDMAVKIKDLLDNKVKREELILKGLEHVKKYMTDENLSKILELLREI